LLVGCHCRVYRHKACLSESRIQLVISTLTPWDDTCLVVPCLSHPRLLSAEGRMNCIPCQPGEHRRSATIGQQSTHMEWREE
jgi:hypothetical protein